MKNLLYYILLASLITTSCSKQLEEEPKSFISPDQFYKSDNDAIQAANGIYFWLRGSYPSRLFQQELFQYLDEDCDLIRTPGAGALNLSSTNPGNANVMYSAFYKGIYNASMLIDRVPQSGSSAIKDRSVGEAKFLRALNYYYATGLFGAVPLIDETNYANADVTKSLPRTAVEGIWTFMVKDLTEAIAVLPDSYSASDNGRATKGAAQTLLTKVYLWQKDWTNAKTVAAAIKASNTYILLSNYADVFSATNEFNKESIFEIDFKADVVNSYQHAFYAPDSRVDVEPFKSKPWYRVYVPYKAFASSYNAGDTRRASVIATSYNGTAFKTDDANHVDVWFGPKWWRLDAGERNSGLDIYVFRYADVLLMLAEAANEADDLGTATDALKEVRTRAGLATATGMTKDQLRTAIRQERAWELVGEGHRLLDLQRWGIYNETAKAAALPEEPIRANSYQTFYKLLPIPASEIQLNPQLLPNNEGY